MSRWIPLVAVVGLAGCLDPFADPTTLSSLRVLAAQVEPPEIRPDQRFEVRALMHSPRVAAPDVRWAACLLEPPFVRGFGAGGGGGGAQTAERIPSEQGDSSPTCVGREFVIEPVELLEGGGAAFEAPPFVRALLDQVAGFQVPDIDPADVPEELRDLLSIPDGSLLAVLHGVHLAVSMEVDDGTETVWANKRVPIKLVPPPGPAGTPVPDEVPGPVAVDYGWTPDSLRWVARFAGGPPPPSESWSLRIHLPDHPAPGSEGEGPPVNTVGRHGGRLDDFGRGARHELEVDLGGDAPVSTLRRADGAGGWRPVTGAAEVRLEGDAVLIELPLEAVELVGRPLAFQVSVLRGGELVDDVPDEGWRYVHAGPPNTNPTMELVIEDEAEDEAEDEDARSVVVVEPEPQRRESYPVVTVRGEVVDTAERWAWSYFTTAGRWGDRRIRGDDADERRNTLHPPDVMPDDARGFVVVRDGRGGAAWTDLAGVLGFPTQPEDGRP